jgi:hypothetical protein
MPTLPAVLTVLESVPLALFPTAIQERISESRLASMFSIDVRTVRAMNMFTHDLLISRAREGHFVVRDWHPRSFEYSLVLDELSRATLGHWSKLLTPAERDERRHVQFVFVSCVVNSKMKEVNHVLQSNSDPRGRHIT